MIEPPYTHDTAIGALRLALEAARDDRTFRVIAARILHQAAATDDLNRHIEAGVLFTCAREVSARWEIR